MAIIQQKYVDVGIGTIYSTTVRGFDPSFSWGTLSDTANGTSNVAVNSVWASTNVIDLYWFSNSITGGKTGIYFRISTLQSDSGFDFIKIGTETYNRTDATSYGQISGNTVWQWSEDTGTNGTYSTNPFGDTAGVDISVTFETAVTSIGISSGEISLGDLQTFFGGSNPASLSEYYRGGGLVPDITENAGIPTSGTISLDDFYDSAK